MIQVVSGRVVIESAGGTVECPAGTLVTFEPGERHALRGLEDTRMLLMLAPWPAIGHNAASETPHDQHLPANAHRGVARLGGHGVLTKPDRESESSSRWK